MFSGEKNHILARCATIKWFAALSEKTERIEKWDRFFYAAAVTNLNLGMYLQYEV